MTGSIQKIQECLLTLLVAGLGLLPVTQVWAGIAAPNDNFANRTVLTGRSPVVATYNDFATLEAGEPSPGESGRSHSLWWSWTAPYTGWASFSTRGSDSALQLEVYLGEELDALSCLGVSIVYRWVKSIPFGYSRWTEPGDVVRTLVREGETYQIAVCMPVAEATGELLTGRVVLGINQPPTIVSKSVLELPAESGVDEEILASDGATHFSAEGLPAGLILNPYSGRLAGTTPSSGEYDVVVSASNAGGVGNARLRLVIEPPEARPTAPPRFRSGDAVIQSWVGESAYAYASVENGPVEWSASNLPPGLYLRPSSASVSISGTAAQAGDYQTILRASNALGAAEAQLTFQIADGSPLPLIGRPAVVQGEVGTEMSYWIYISNANDAIVQTGELPPGLSRDGDYIRGIPTIAGTYEISLSATNSRGTTRALLTMVIADSTEELEPTAPPVIISRAAAAGYVGGAFSYTVVEKEPGSTFSASGLPAGLAINPATGVISGRPTETGTFTVMITATNALGSTTTPLTLIFRSSVPFRLSSAALAIGAVGDSFSYAIRAERTGEFSYPYPVSEQIALSLGELPPGLSYFAYPYYPGSSYDPVGYISGTPTEAGTYRIPISASLGGTTLPATLTIVVEAGSSRAPVITSAASREGTSNASFSYTISATNTPTSFAATGLPAGLSLNSSSGAITGSPTQRGEFVVDVSASNSRGTGTARVTFVISPAGKGTFYGYPAEVEGVVGVKVSVSGGYSATGSSTVSASGLPPGLSISSSGTLSGVPTTAGDFPATITANGAGGRSSIPVTFRIRPLPTPPVITSRPTATASVGESFNYSVGTSGQLSGVVVGPVPEGLSAGASSISGVPTRAGIYEIPITATNAGGSMTATLTLRVLPQAAPRLAVTTSREFTQGSNLSFYIYPTGTVSQISVTGTLPPGVSLDTGSLATGSSRFTGNPTTTGVFPVEIVLTGPGGTTRAPFTFVVIPRGIPLITANLIVYHPPGYSTFISASNSPTSFSVENLPSGLTFHNSSSSGYVTGSLRAAGPFPVKFTAANAWGSAQATIGFTTLSILNFGFSPALVEAIVGTPFSYQPYTGSSYYMSDRTYAADQLPPGLSLNTATGEISGTPTVTGNYVVPITATHSSYPPIGMTLTIRVVPDTRLPIVSATSVVEGIVGQSLDRYLSLNGTSFRMEGLPAGLEFVASSRAIEGTPTVAGDFKVRLIVGNSAGEQSYDMLVRIATTPPLPDMTSPASLQVRVGESVSSYLYASNSPTSFSAQDLPPGLSFDAASGRISGRPTAAGVYVANIEVSNGGGTTRAKLTIHVLDQARPVITSVPEIVATEGESVYYTLNASHAPTSFGASNLPAGLYLNPLTGRIDGAPLAVGEFMVPVSATNAAGTTAVALKIRVEPRKPVLLTSQAVIPGCVGENLSTYLSVSRSYSSVTTRFAVENLPPGLSMDPEADRITGVPTTAGRYEVPVQCITGTQLTTAILVFEIASEPLRIPMSSLPLMVLTSPDQGLILSSNFTNRPAQLAASASPDGTSFDAGSGTLSGFLAEGVSEVEFSATNLRGTSSASVTLISNAAENRPIVLTPANLFVAVNEPCAYPIPVSANDPSFDPFPSSSLVRSTLPYHLAIRGLPPGLYLDAIDDEIKGTPTMPGIFPVELTIFTGLEQTTSSLLLHVTGSPAVTRNLAVSSSVILHVFGAVGSPFAYSLIPAGLATDVTCEGLPPGLILEKRKGVSNGEATLFGELSGHPTKPGQYPVKFTFSNADQTVTGTVTIVIPTSPERPDPYAEIAATGREGEIFHSYFGNGEGYRLNNGATSFELGELPAGLRFDDQNYGIEGTPGVSGSFVIPIELRNAGGATSFQHIIRIEPQGSTPPVVLGPDGYELGAVEVGYLGERFSLTFRTRDSATQLSIADLPPTLKLTQQSDTIWLLAGSLSEIGTMSLTLNAENGSGTSIIPLQLEVRALDDSVTAPPADAPPALDVEGRRPVVAINKRRNIRSERSAFTIRGRISNYRSGMGLTAHLRAGSEWMRVPVSSAGRFTLGVSDLPLGATKVRLRARDAEGRQRTLRVFIRRSNPQ